MAIEVAVAGEPAVLEVGAADRRRIASSGRGLVGVRPAGQGAVALGGSRFPSCAALLNRDRDRRECSRGAPAARRPRPALGSTGDRAPVPDRGSVGHLRRLARRFPPPTRSARRGRRGSGPRPRLPHAVDGPGDGQRGVLRAPADRRRSRPTSSASAAPRARSASRWSCRRRSCGAPRWTRLRAPERDAASSRGSCLVGATRPTTSARSPRPAACCAAPGSPWRSPRSPPRRTTITGADW